VNLYLTFIISRIALWINFPDSETQLKYHKLNSLADLSHIWFISLIFSVIKLIRLFSIRLLLCSILFLVYVFLVFTHWFFFQRTWNFYNWEIFVSILFFYRYFIWLRINFSIVFNNSIKILFHSMEQNFNRVIKDYWFYEYWFYTITNNDLYFHRERVSIRNFWTLYFYV